MLIVILLLATAMIGGWFALLHQVQKEDLILQAYTKVFDTMGAIEKLRIKEKRNKEKLTQYHGGAFKVMSLFLGTDFQKEISKLENKNKQLQSGNLKELSIFPMPGHVLLRKFEFIVHSNLHKVILTKSIELYGKKHAANKTKQLLACLLSYPLIGVSIVFLLGALVMATGNMKLGLGILVLGSFLVLMVVYAMYDELSDQANKRRDDIARQFPNMVSKLALLVTSGMIMERAWKETAYSQHTALYIEMQKTAEELDNLVQPEVAYSNFINRCNTKETAKLSSAIMQNLSKGNAEIGGLLKQMAKEAWLERRHTAKRDSEKANALLMIPTMLLFLAILVMIMVPVAMSFSFL